MTVKIEKSWSDVLADEFAKPYFEQLTQFVRNEYRTSQIFPPGKQIFAAFDATPFNDVKVVIIGQDPYHGDRQANGLCFSVNEGIECPPSLINIFKELSDDLGVAMRTSGDLSDWARQGVLLLNSTLTVKAHCAGSHQGHGWETFTDAVINRLANMRNHLVFILWGSYAIRKGAFIDRSRHLVITSPHPSPLSAYRGFFGSRPFSTANAYLESNGIKPINW
ncbi:MAG: uracil-DNA glycosylase [Muribaculaceae bacterium]|nr:uracil-DNA glycosylase [Muribaculaceae bacterium]MDY3932826.1 uracil-DNA glycosylase [Muribaculaceae bacterium]